MTRALALHGVDAARRLAEGLRILPLHGLTRFLWPQVKLPYKQAEGHWVRRYSGGTENASILRTLSREMLECRAASR